MSSAIAAGSEIDRMDPVPVPVQLVSGIKVYILPLRMRQMFKLLRIITRGGAHYIPMLKDALVSDDPSEVFGTQLLAIAMLALPEAEDQATEFIQSVVEPVDLRRGNDKQTKEHNAGVRQTLLLELDNPDLDDVVTIIEKVIEQEKDDLAALGKRLAAMFRAAMKTEPVLATLAESSAQIQASQEDSPEPATLSHLNTGGPTITSSTSPSDE